MAMGTHDDDIIIFLVDFLKNHFHWIAYFHNDFFHQEGAGRQGVIEGVRQAGR